MRGAHWQHGLAAAALTLVVGAALCYALVRPGVASRIAFAERWQTLQVQRQQFMATAAAAPALERQLQVLAGLEAGQQGFLEEKPHALAAADLQQLIQALVSETGGSLTSTQVLPGADDARLFPEVSVRTRLRCNTRSLQALLYRIDEGPLLLRVDNLRALRQQADSRADARNVRYLDVVLELTAFIHTR